MSFIAAVVLTILHGFFFGIGLGLAVLVVVETYGRLHAWREYRRAVTRDRARAA